MRRKSCLVGRWVPSPPPILFAAVSLVFLANNALAQKKPKAEKKADGPSASATWTDPTESEKSDKGPYTPHKEVSDEPAPDPKGPKAQDPGRKRDPIAAFAQIVIGFGKLPMENPSYDDAPSGQGTAIGLQLGGRYDVNKDLSVGLRIPLTTATVKQTNGTNQSSTAFGAPELFGEYRLSLNRLTSVPILFGLGVPVAQGQPDQTSLDRAARAKDEVNRFADATTGWRDSELFMPKHLPIVLGAGVHHERRDWELHGDVKLALLPALTTKVNRAEDPTNTGTYKLNAFAMREVTTLGGSYNFLDKPLFYGGLDLALVWTPLQAFKFTSTQNVTEPSSLQAILEPKIGARFGAVSPNVSYIAPLGGRLGHTGIGGVRLHVDAYF
jgi:hypothetical protein